MSAGVGPEEHLVESERLHARVRAFVGGSRADDFDRLACDLARFQARRVDPVGRLLAARGVDASALARAEDIPALPTDVFKLRRVAAHPPAADARLFATSGTTVGARGRHPMRELGSYVAAALAWGARALWPDGPRLRLVALVASEAHAFDSSLSFMIARFAERLTGPSSFHFDGRALDVPGVEVACDGARRAGVPVLLATTAFALAWLCEAAPTGCALPAGSRIMQTGGFKGRAKEVDPDELAAAACALFHVPRSHVVGEYGMTELSSQLYEGALAEALGSPIGPADAYVPPPWLRVQAVDPETLAARPAGEVGLGRFVDLANVDSAVAVQTADLVRVRSDGGVELLGRAPGAAPRGCSLAVEEALEGGG